MGRFGNGYIPAGFCLTSRRKGGCVVRVLVSIAPRSYREAVAVALQRRRPRLEVRIAPPEDLDREVGSFGPHLVVCIGVTALVRAEVLSWVEVAFEDGLDAAVSIGGRTSRVRDVSMQDLVSAVDETEKLVLRG